LDKPNKNILRLVEARAEILENIWGSEKLYNHSFLCSVSFPHRDLKDQRTYSKKSGSVSMQLEAGSVPDGHGNFVPVGLPYGPRARLLMLHLCSLAVKQKSPTVEVEDSFTAFAKALGIPISGQSFKSLREQIVRTAAVSIRLAKTNEHYIETFQSTIFSEFVSPLPGHPLQRVLFPSYVKFSHRFYISLLDHAVPLRLEAIQGLRHSSRGLDIYCWLAARLCRLQKPTTIRWTSLRFQFGERTQDMKGFKRRFKEALKQVLIVYPEAKISVISGGVAIAPSRPPVPKRKSRGLIE